MVWWFKKVIFFIIGLFLIPLLIGISLSFVFKWQDDQCVDFFATVYVLIYLIFPLLYRGKIKNKIVNRYVLYLLLYLPFIFLFVLGRFF